MIKFLFLTIPSTILKQHRLIHLRTAKKPNKFQIGYLWRNNMDNETPINHILQRPKNKACIQTRRGESITS